ncbi:MAG TPA: patatin-like phospholipase family protein [Bacteroidales bacterium]|nr:patatin-like phospholipase family protein [Bacteroidales bacterium]
MSFLPILSNSQDHPLRPSVGLVLSGGGAHGIAHLGVIMVIEEAGLRPDCISGTSMGSIIGGMYATGYTADSLFRLLKAVNWNEMLSNRMSEDRIVFPEKPRFYNSIISLSVKKNKVNIPSGLNNGQLIENSLSYYTWPVADINDFSRLPIPFTCNATDIVTYKKINFNQGYLSDAIRASFSVPSIFTAHEIDTLLLLDGGLIRNFAASEAKEMGADILIGSYVGFEKNSVEKLQTMPGILEQIAMFRSLEDFNEEKKLVNILVKPAVERFSVSDFNNVDSLVHAGYVAAVPFREKFRKLADSLNSFGEQAELPFLLNKNTYTFDKIEITGNKVYSTEQIAGVLDVKAGEVVERDFLTKRIELLYGRSWFDKVKYRIIPRNDSLILAIDCKEKPRAMIYGSVHYNNSLQSGLILGFTLKNLPVRRTVIDLNSYMGKYYRVKTGILQYLGRNQKFGLTMNYLIDNTLFPWFEHNNETGNTLSKNQSFNAGINNYIGLNNAITLSGSYHETNLKPDFISNNSIINYSYDYWASDLKFSRNTLNNIHFPDKGIIIDITAGVSKLRYASQNTGNTEIPLTYNPEYKPENFYTIRAGIRQYFSRGKRTTFSIGFETLYITDTDSLSSKNNFFLLGGIQSDTRRSLLMTGFNPNEIKVRRMSILRTELDIEFVRDLHINVMADLAAMEDNNYPYELIVLSGYGFGIGYNSIIGPVKAGIMYGVSPTETHFSSFKSYISIGYNF